MSDELKCPECNETTKTAEYSHEKGCWICKCGNINNVFEMVIKWQSRALTAEKDLENILSGDKDTLIHQLHKTEALNSKLADEVNFEQFKGSVGIENIKEAWMGYQLIRDVLEELGVVGSVKTGELCRDFTEEATALVEGIKKNLEEVKRLKDTFTARVDLSMFFYCRPESSKDEIEVKRLITSAEQMRKEGL